MGLRLRLYYRGKMVGEIEKVETEVEVFPRFRMFGRCCRCLIEGIMHRLYFSVSWRNILDATYYETTQLV